MSSGSSKSLSTDGSDFAAPLLEVLERSFSTIVARTLLMVARRRAGCSTDPLSAGDAAAVIRALEDSLPAYLADTERRRSCETALKNSLLTSTSPTPPAAKRIAVRSDADLRLVTDTVRTLARELGMSVLDQTKLMTASAELVRNMLQYAGSGEFQVSIVDRPRKGLSISAIDHGPGIPDVGRVMAPSYTSRTGMGIGLQGTKRLMDEFEIESSAAKGTSVRLRKYA